MGRTDRRAVFVRRDWPGLVPGLLFFLALLAVPLTVQFLRTSGPVDRTTHLSPPEIQHFTFGLRETSADLLWVRALQDFDYCEKEVAHKVCQSSGWLYSMLDLLTDLSPKFRIPYATGALALTVLVNDFAGASKLFDKGVREFPRDWPLLSRAAYHALYEEKNNAKAAALLKQAAENGGPAWYYMLATRLKAKDGDPGFGQALIRQLEGEPRPDRLLIESLKKRIADPSYHIPAR